MRRGADQLRAVPVAGVPINSGQCGGGRESTQGCAGGRRSLGTTALPPRIRRGRLVGLSILGRWVILG